MLIRHITIFLLLTTSYFLLSTHYIFAGGIATTFTGINLENLTINTTYNLTISNNLPLKVINKSNTAIEVVIKIEKPTDVVGAGLPARDYKPIPDTKWISVNPNRYHLGAGQTGSSDVILIIPKDKKLRERKFQVNFEICGYPAEKKGSVLVIPSLLTKMRFSISKKKK